MTDIGLIALFGSGETSPGAQRIHHFVMEQLPRPTRVAILETPAGFEPNSDRVAGAIGEYLEHRLQNFSPRVDYVCARKRDTPYSPDDPSIASPILSADYLFMGPGSPTYAVRQLRDSFTWYSLLARHRLGAAVAFSSATSIAVSRHALPVYEIYKVGEELHWKQGLDFFGAFGLSLVIIPHWNNNDGGDGLDTSRCYMGRERYDRLVAMLPADATILGIDENTGVVISPATGTCEIVGPGGAVVIRDGESNRFSSRQTFPVTLLGEWRLPDPDQGVPQDVWRAAVDADTAIATMEEPIPAQVEQLVAEREDARQQRDWSKADQLRDRILALGWHVMDTPEGPQLARAG